MKKFAILTGILAVFSCGNPAEPETAASAGPALVSSSPVDGTGGIEASSLSIVFTFDQNILCTSASLEGVSVDGGAFIDGIHPSGATLTVVVAGLARGKHYTLALPAGTVQGFRQDQKASAAIAFGFSTKELDPAPDPGNWESAASAVQNMGAGWNLGNTFDTNSGDITDMWFESHTDRTPTAYETGWGQPVTTRKLIHMFKKAGFNTIRVPVTWYPHIGTLEVVAGRWDRDKWLESTDYRVDPAWMARVREVVDYVIDEGMYCILNVHHDTGDHGKEKKGAAWLVADQFDAAKDRYAALWQQIAETFQDYGERLLFESFNEMLDSYDSWCYATFASPGGYDAQVAAAAYAGINNYARTFVETVRATGGNNTARNLVVNTYGACSGAGTWNPHLQEPLTRFDLPESPGHIAVQVHSYWEADKFDEQKADIDSQFTDLDQYIVRRLGVPVIIGEWGGSANEDSAAMIHFAGYFSQKAKDAGVAALYWMCLSDGADRAVPTWTTPGVKDAIVKPYL